MPHPFLVIETYMYVGGNRNKWCARGPTHEDPSGPDYGSGLHHSYMDDKPLFLLKNFFSATLKIKTHKYIG